MILAVENLKDFHKENMAMNKDHYTYMARFTKGRVVTYFQDKGAKMHFNYMKVNDPELSE